MCDNRQLDLFDIDTTSAAVMPTSARTILTFPVRKRARRDGTEPVINLSTVVVSFPQDRRHTKVLDVATKLLAKTTSRAVKHYRSQVTEAMVAHLTSRRIPARQHGELVRRFWVGVDCEVARRVNGRPRPGSEAL